MTSRQREFNMLQKAPLTMKINVNSLGSLALLMKQYNVLAKSSEQPTDVNLR